MKFFAIIFSVFIAQMATAQRVDFLKMKKYRIAVLSDSLRENSALNFHQGKLLSINDSGNSPEIFQIDSITGKIKNKFLIDCINNDWEAITSDKTNIYIGDIGNNAGRRTDLLIYKIPFQDSLELSKIQKISFKYPEQSLLTRATHPTDFDAEAMIFHQHKIHIFSKEWTRKSTTHYIIDPYITENQLANKVETFPIGYLVTDAAYFNKQLFLVGYSKTAAVFLDIFKESSAGLFFEEKPKRFYLGSATSIGQVEGIAVTASGAYISAESLDISFLRTKPFLYFIPMEDLK